MNPNLGLARDRSTIAHQILVKFKEMGFPEENDEDLAKLCTDLADLWGAQKSYNEVLLDLIENKSHDWKLIAQRLTDIKSQVDHMSWHIASVKDPLEKIAIESYELGEIT